MRVVADERPFGCGPVTGYDKTIAALCWASRSECFGDRLDALQTLSVVISVVWNNDRTLLVVRRQELLRHRILRLRDDARPADLYRGVFGQHPRHKFDDDE